MNQRLLIVEDEDHLAFALEFNLKEEGYRVDVAMTLGQAQALLPNGYDAILLDVMLPDGNGFEFCKELRQNANTVPVVFLTAKGSLDDIVSGLEAGGDDYVIKPFALAELIGRVGALLRRRGWDRATPAQRSSPADEYRFGEHWVNFVTREARAWGRPAELTDLEFKILKYFADHPGRVVGRQELLANVWEVSPSSNTRTVDVFVARLRRSFERDPANPVYFETVRGQGYRFLPGPSRE
jgi:two-component system, OmpR family, alkaline phosphatase synthesis response regulator PhoP